MPDPDPIQVAGVKPPSVDEGTPKPAPAPTPAPALDPAKLTADITSAVVKGIGDLAKEAAEKRPAQPAAQAPQPQATQPARDPIADLVAPIVGPALQHVGVRAEAAMDAATFYADPDPVMATFKAKHRDRIEQAFNQELAASRFTPREAIIKYLRGGELYKEVLAAEFASAKAAEEAARLAETAGPGSSRGQTGGAPKDPWAMAPEELDKALDGVAF